MLKSTRYSVLLKSLAFSGCLWPLAQAATAQAPSKQWDRIFGGDVSDAAKISQRTTDGGYIIGGTSASGITGDKSQASQGDIDYWVVKFDASGNKQWDKTFGGSGRDGLNSLQQTADGGYILGGYSNSGISGDKTQASQGGYDYWVLKLTASGSKQWDKTFGGNDEDNLNSLRQTADGGFILGGTSKSTTAGDKTQPSRGGEDYWVVKLNASGTKQWDQTYGGSGADELKHVLQTPDGGYAVAGLSPSGIGGEKSEASRGLLDYWLLKLDATGTKQWDTTYGGTINDRLAHFQQTSDGGFLLGGASASGIGGEKSQPSRGSFDYWVVKTDASGVKQWDQTYGGNGADQLVCLQQTTDGGYLLGGNSTSGISGDHTSASYNPGLPFNDFWLVKLNGSGAKQWDVTLGGTSNDELASLDQTPDGSYLISGTSNSRISGDKSQAPLGSTHAVNIFDGVILQEHYEDFWVVKLATLLTIRPTSTRNTLQVYPNPAQTTLNVPWPTSVSTTAPLQLRLLDVMGRVVHQQLLRTTQGLPIAVPLARQAAGVYFLRVEGPGGYVGTQQVLLE